ncbi:polysaccharide deacetylase family protein [Devosia geojensis]|uniref:polysaccharide deacetylase family protein n=1 Tax=Devosia geojensis TaxID=443610 RepID=UPI000B13A79B|nr:polysaccharide deacetylase family protein [Devosia geojensis]
MGLKYTAIRAVFEALWLSRLPALTRTLSSCRGVIFTLHRVLPDTPAPFSPNAILQVRPDFLDYCIERVRALDIDIITLDEAMERLRKPKAVRRFAVFTFDDAYRDNLEYALPILRRQDCPFTLYVPTGLVDGEGELWWQALEDIIAANNEVVANNERLATATLADKQQAFDTLYWRMRKMPEPDRLQLLYRLAAHHGFDLADQCRRLIMDWSELRQFADDPLCTIGAHTVKHYELAKLPPDEAREEIAHSVDILGAKFGKRPRHFSYPLGGPLSAGEREFDLARELGLATAVTTRPGGLYPHHRETPTALPRVSLNGLFQERRYVDVFASGAVFTWLGRMNG